MRELAFYIGAMCLLFVAFERIIDFVPIDAWTCVMDIFIDRPEGFYYKVVPSENAGIKMIELTIGGKNCILLSSPNFKK